MLVGGIKTMTRGRVTAARIPARLLLMSPTVITAGTSRRCARGDRRHETNAQRAARGT
jgi:hypothetical protein